MNLIKHPMSDLDIPELRITSHLPNCSMQTPSETILSMFHIPEALRHTVMPGLQPG